MGQALKLLVLAIGAYWLGEPPALADNITGAGSTFVLPILATWASAYKGETGVLINYQGVGSGAGIRAIKSKGVDFGASDAPLRPEELERTGLIQFPIVTGGVVPVVNIEGIGPGQLRLTGAVLADIYLGRITRWNDKAITELNLGVTLPDQAIVPIHRSDGSGTTFVFADYLASVSADWRRQMGVSTAVEFPGGIGGKGNEGVAAFTATTRGAIGYVEYAYAKQNKLAYPLLKTHDGDFVAPSRQAFQSAAANANWSAAPGFYVLLTDQPGSQSWPINGSTFVLMFKQPQRPFAASEILKFFDWAYRNGSKMADALDYLPMPESVVQLVEAAWADIKEPDGKKAWAPGAAAQH